MLRAWRRLALARRLTKCRVDSGGDTVDSDTALYSVVELLDDHQLELLVSAVETGGSAVSDGHINECIVVDSSANSAPQLICCRLWRWPLLQHSEDIRCMPWCQNKHGNGGALESSRAVCCHPFHWSRQLIPVHSDLPFAESPPPPYISPASSEKQLTGCFSADLSDDFSVSDVDDICDGKNASAWCHVSYWEFRHRVGQQFSVVNNWTHVYQDLPLCDGVSLSELQEQSSLGVPCQCRKLSDADQAAVNRTRAKIGRGIVLSHESGSVWLYNCSKYPVFVRSPTFSQLHHSPCSPLIQRLSPGDCLCAFDGDLIVKLAVGELSCGHYSIQISFAKGWGVDYSRQVITACPCWIEVHITHPHHSPVT